MKESNIFQDTKLVFQVIKQLNTFIQVCFDSSFKLMKSKWM